MLKLNDIAKEAGVSVSTVSKALRNSADLNKETAKKIQKIAKRLQYKSKSWQQENVRIQKFVGIICPEVRSNFYSQIVTQMAELLNEHGIGIMLCFTDFSIEREVQYLHLLHEKKASGVFYLTEDPSSVRQAITLVEAGSIPVIQVGINVEANEFDNIFVDDAAGIGYAIEHLISYGHQRIAFIGDPFARSRLDAFKKYMEKQSLPIHEDYICQGYDRFEECGYKQMDKLLSLKTPPTGVITQYDEIAVGAMRKLFENGLQVPGDMSIIGMENVTYAGFLYKGITTIAGHVGEMAEIAVNLLLRKIEDKDYKVIQRVQLIPELIIRETTGPAKIEEEQKNIEN